MGISFYNPGNVTVITGLMDDGKTDLGLKFAEIGLYQGTRLITNVLVSTNPNIKLIQNDVDLFTYLLDNREHITTIVLDEAGVFASSKRSGGLTAIYLDSFVYLIRKFNAVLFYIVQREMSALKSIREVTNHWVHKISKKEANVQWKGYNIRMHNVPRTVIPFETRAIASFRFKLDIERIWEELSGIPLDDMYEKLEYIISNEKKWYNKKYREYLIKTEKDMAEA